ncbi:MAG: GIY-YIG nuclease family protein [Microbacteriaceae bacterium]|nr:GIY-YIG nuclease family protein [Microbacteriaceae bacterium]
MPSSVASRKSDAHKIPYDTQLALGCYVYALRDPRNGEVFYVGKGKGERILQHVAESGKNPLSEKAKLKRIKDIEADGLKVEHLFLRTGMDDDLAFAIEQAVIDAFLANRATSNGVSRLTNLVAGHEHDELGLASLETVLARHGKTKTPPINEPILVLKLNQRWEPDMNPESLLKVSQGVWRVGREIRERAQIALVISFGIIRGVYEIDRAGWKPSPKDEDKGKWIFTGKVLSDPKFTSLIGTDMGQQVHNQVSFQKFLDGFNPVN